MFQVGDIVAMSWPAWYPHEEESWSYGVVTSIAPEDTGGDGIHVLWFHREVDTWYRIGYALKHFKKVDNGKR
jgi:cell wall assembly regulator SMI1